MGRKTWDSIPDSRRPLKDRDNIVLTRSTNPLPFAVDSFDKAVQVIQSTPNPRRAFVIGGAEIYREALERRETKRILFTRILSDFACDTYFPITLDDMGTAAGWRRTPKADLDAWTGEIIPEGVQEENDTRYIFEMWEKA